MAPQHPEPAARRPLVRAGSLPELDGYGEECGRVERFSLPVPSATARERELERENARLREEIAMLRRLLPRGPIEARRQNRRW